MKIRRRAEIKGLVIPLIQLILNKILRESDFFWLFQLVDIANISVIAIVLVIVLK